MNNLVDQARQLDAQDPLRIYREEFYLVPDAIYMDGNSLGLFSKHAEKSLQDVVGAVKRLGIDGWLQGEYPWFYLAEILGQKIAPLLGATSGEVIVTNSTTVNLHQLVATFYRPEKMRNKILIDEFAFPSDVYALQSQLRLRGLDSQKHLVSVKSRNGMVIEERDIRAAMTPEVALVILPTVIYTTGQLLDIPSLTQAAHERGIHIIFDASHSVGVVPHEFHKDEVDAAFFCGYKYLNGGPGAVGGLYVHEKHFGKAPGLAGWFSSRKEKQFDMSHVLIPAGDVGAYQIGTPHVLSMAPLLGSLELFAEVGIEALRQKSLLLTRYLMELVTTELADMGITIVTPQAAARRGGHVALCHTYAASICKALKDKGVIPDFRPPNIIRLAPIPFYTSFGEVYKTVQILKNIMETKQYEKYTNKRALIA